MARIVIDANVVLAWLFDEPAASAVQPVLMQSECVVPWLWRLEVANAILVRERRKTLTKEQSSEAMAILESLQVEVASEPAERDVAAIVTFARPHQLTAYDATYLELSIRLGVPLFTHDRNLLMAAGKLGVPLF